MTAPVLQLPIKVLRSATAGRRPGDSTFRALTDGEVFINTQDRVLCYLSASGVLLTVPFDPVFFAGLAPLASPGFTGSPTAPTPAAGDASTKLATTAYADRAAAAVGAFKAPASAIAGLISGLRLSNDTTTPATVLDIAAGVATSDDATTSIVLAAAWTKTTAAWAAGSGTGGLDTGTVAASTWYHVFLVSGTAGLDLLLSKSATAPTMPSGYTVKRRIGSIKTNSSSNIVAFNQTGDRFDLAAPVLEVNGTLGTTAATTVTLGGVPTGVPVQALLTGYSADSNGGSPILYLSSLGQADLVPGASPYTTQGTGTGIGTYNTSVTTNTAAQIRARTQTSTLNISVVTTGYIDTRGRG